MKEPKWISRLLMLAAVGLGWLLLQVANDEAVTVFVYYNLVLLVMFGHYSSRMDDRLMRYEWDNRWLQDRERSRQQERERELGTVIRDDDFKYRPKNI